MLYDPDLIVTTENRKSIQKWLIAAGWPDVQVYSMGAVALANAYHAAGGPSDVQRAATEALVRTLQAFGSFDPEPLRMMVRQEVEAVAPRRLEISGPVITSTINGPTHYKTPQIIQIVALGHPVMMVGPAGCGKTTIGEHTAMALGLPFYITSTINDTHELTGFIDGYGTYRGTPFRSAYQHGGIWIADEIDAWDASALLAANSALANGYTTFPDNHAPVMRHTDFRMVATANTFGTGADRIYIGRNELDAASLDRFATVNVDYDLTLEQLFAGDQQRWLEHVWSIRKIVQEKRIRHVVSSRCIGMGAAALRAGLTWNDVCDIYLFKGMSAKDRDKIDDN